MTRRTTTKHKPAALIADVDDVQEFASTIRESWVNCRAYGHDWRPFKVEQTENNTFVVIRKCRQCSGTRTQVIDRYGLIINTEYKLPDGYQMPRGTGRLDSEGRGVFRLSAITAEFARYARRSA